jgi:hypothetical protein
VFGLAIEVISRHQEAARSRGGKSDGREGLVVAGETTFLICMAAGARDQGRDSAAYRRPDPIGLGEWEWDGQSEDEHGGDHLLISEPTAIHPGYTTPETAGSLTDLFFRRRHDSIEGEAKMPSYVLHGG